MGKSICSAQHLNITIQKEAFNEVAVVHGKTTIVITNCITQIINNLQGLGSIHLHIQHPSTKEKERMKNTFCFNQGSDSAATKVREDRTYHHKEYKTAFVCHYMIVKLPSTFLVALCFWWKDLNDQRSLLSARAVVLPLVLLFWLSKKLEQIFL